MRRLGLTVVLSAVVPVVVPVVVSLVVSLVVSTGIASASGGVGGHRRAAPLASTGYILSGSPSGLVARDAHALATLGVDGVTITPDGRRVHAPDAGARRLLAAAHRHGLRAELLVSNYSDTLGDFDARAVARLLRHPDRIAAVAARLASYAVRQGWDGIQVDLELMSRADGRGVVGLARALQADMPADRTVSMAVSATGSLRGYRARGYRLGALGRVLDTLTLMTYDQHGPGWSGPGPIGAKAWQQRTLGVCLAKVPAGKVDLGVAGYGYAWRPDGSGFAVSDRRARHLVAADGAVAVWKHGAGEWTAHLSDGRVLWWSDARSYRVRLRMARAAGLHGTSVWRLGSADPLP